MDLVAASPMPITLSTSDVAYERLVAQGGLEAALEGHRCPRCNRPVEPTGRRRRRGCVRLVDGECVASSIVVVLARCREGHLTRVLPANLQPGTVYSVEAQEAACRSYLEGRGGLRVAVRRLGADAPHFTTLHGWLGGLGGFALGLETPAGETPAAVLLEETRRRELPDLHERWDATAQVDPSRYRSDARRELLEASVRFLAVATALVAQPTPPPPVSPRSSLSEWIRLALTWPAVTAVCWSARRRGTAIQPQPRRSGVRFRRSQAMKPETTPWQTHSRSPPSDSR